MLYNSKTILTLTALMATLALGCATQTEQPQAEPAAEESAAKALTAEAAPTPAPQVAAADATEPRKGRGRMSFEKIDTNQDGFLSKEEINAGHLKRVDADGNGQISKEEHDAYKAKKRGHKGHAKGTCECPNCAGKPACDGDCENCPKKADGTCECPNCGDKPACDGENCPEKAECRHKRPSFEECDANTDGSLSLDEIQKGDRLITKMDTDKDGKISKAEYDAHHKGRGHGGHGHGGHGHGHGHDHGHGHGHAH